MVPHLHLIRAIGSEFVGRKIKPFILVFVIAAVLVLAAAVWLVTVNAWWWLLTAPVLLVILVGIVICAVVTIIVRMLRPRQTPAQASAISDFADKLERVADNLQMPMPFIIVRIIRDLLFPRPHTFIHSLTRDGTTLHGDFLRLQRSFKNS